MLVPVFVDYADKSADIVIDYADTTMTMRTRADIVIDYADTTMTMGTVRMSGRVFVV